MDKLIYTVSFRVVCSWLRFDSESAKFSYFYAIIENCVDHDIRDCLTLNLKLRLVLL